MLIKVLNGQLNKYPYNFSDLRSENPNTSFPEKMSEESLAAYNVYSVLETSPPVADSKTHRVIQTAENLGGVWTQVWKTVKLPLSTASDNVRAYRNSILNDSDWTQVADAPVDKAAWASYRQALRDIPAQPGFPWEVQWPEMP